jgi:hypothetical protein
MKFLYDDGGRKSSGYKGSAGDCVARAVAIVTGSDYADVYSELSALAGLERKSRGASARNGIRTSRKWFKDYMQACGFSWTPTMGIGTGCKVHLADGELPAGRLVVAVSRHYTAVVDGVIHDTFDPQRSTVFYDGQEPDGSAHVSRVAQRCVYGYWKFSA